MSPASEARRWRPRWYRHNHASRMLPVHRTPRRRGGCSRKAGAYGRATRRNRYDSAHLSLLTTDRDLLEMIVIHVNLQTTQGSHIRVRGRSPRCAAFTDKSDPVGALRLSTCEQQQKLHNLRTDAICVCFCQRCPRIKILANAGPIVPLRAALTHVVVLCSTLF